MRGFTFYLLAFPPIDNAPSLCGFFFFFEVANARVNVLLQWYVLYNFFFACLFLKKRCLLLYDFLLVSLPRYSPTSPQTTCLFLFFRLVFLSFCFMNVLFAPVKPSRSHRKKRKSNKTPRKTRGARIPVYLWWGVVLMVVPMSTEDAWLCIRWPNAMALCMLRAHILQKK